LLAPPSSHTTVRTVPSTAVQVTGVSSVEGRGYTNAGEQGIDSPSISIAPGKTGARKVHGLRIRVGADPRSDRRRLNVESRSPLHAHFDGFDLHTEHFIAADDREGMEHALPALVPVVREGSGISRPSPIRPR